MKLCYEDLQTFARFHEIFNYLPKFAGFANLNKKKTREIANETSEIFFDPIAHTNLNFVVVGFKVISLHFWSNHRIIKRVLKHIDQNVKNSRLIP